MALTFCTDHWKAWMQSIDDCGLKHLCSRDAKEAVENMSAEIKRDGDPGKTFEPALSGMMMIFHNFIDQTSEHNPQSAMTLLNDPVMHCPLCLVENDHAGMAKDWINGCSAEVLDRARSLKLVPGVQ